MHRVASDHIFDNAKPESKKCCWAIQICMESESIITEYKKATELDLLHFIQIMCECEKMQTNWETEKRSRFFRRVASETIVCIYFIFSSLFYSFSSFCIHEFGYKHCVHAEMIHDNEFTSWKEIIFSACENIILFVHSQIATTTQSKERKRKKLWKILRRSKQSIEESFTVCCSLFWINYGAYTFPFSLSLSFLQQFHFLYTQFVPKRKCFCTLHSIAYQFIFTHTQESFPLFSALSRFVYFLFAV